MVPLRPLELHPPRAALVPQPKEDPRAHAAAQRQRQEEEGEGGQVHFRFLCERLREIRLLASAGRGPKFTQPFILQSTEVV